MSAAPIWEVLDWLDIKEFDRLFLEQDYDAYAEEVYGQRVCRRCWKAYPLVDRWFAKVKGVFIRSCRVCSIKENPRKRLTTSRAAA